jgi:hypothetical protein
MVYRYIKSKYALKSGKRKDEHRIIMEGYLGRELENGEVAHHCNNNGKDNRIENLELMLKSEHARMHMLGYKRKNGPDGTSWCAGCQTFLPIETFSHDRRNISGLRCYCKSCKKSKGF